MFVFFIKQKTAYEVRISDWSSDVRSSDLPMHSHLRRLARPAIGLGLAILVVLGLAGGARAGDAKPQHRLVIQVDDNDPAKMNLALNNLTNIYEYYQQKGETEIGRAHV